MESDVIIINYGLYVGLASAFFGIEYKFKA